MRYAVSAKYKQFCSCFEECAEFAIMDVVDNTIVSENFWSSPPKLPGLVSSWFVDDMKVDAVITGHIDAQTELLLKEKNIQVVTGAEHQSTRTILEEYLTDSGEAGVGGCGF